MYLLTVSFLLFSSTFIQISTTQVPSSRRSHTNDKCVCFPTGQTDVTNLLNSQNGLERLVIFLYKDVATNEIKMFVPNPEKQRLIPNLSFEEADVLKTISTDSIASLLTININNGPNSYQPDVIKHAGPNPGYIHIIHDNQQPNNEQHNSGSQSYIKDFIKIDVQDFQENIEIDKQPNSITFIQIPYNQKHNGLLKPYEPNSPLNSYQENEPVRPNKAAVFDQDQDFVANEGSLSRELTFGQWFDQQLHLFIDAKFGQDIDTINTDFLKYWIEKVLFENHMHISPTGLITDDNGVRIHINNLQLRPILTFDNSVTYQEALTGHPQLSSSKNVQYLEGILIILVNPTKVLGVIPLKGKNISKNSLDDSNSAPKFNFLNPFGNQPNSPQSFSTADVSYSGTIDSFKINEFSSPQTNSFSGHRENKPPNSVDGTLTPEAITTPKNVYGILGFDSKSVWRPGSQYYWKRPSRPEWFYSVPKISTYSKDDDFIKSHLFVTPLNHKLSLSSHVNSNLKYYPILSAQPHSKQDSNFLLTTKSNLSYNPYRIVTSYSKKPILGFDITNKWQSHSDSITPFINPYQTLHSNTVVQPIATIISPSNKNWDSYATVVTEKTVIINPQQTEGLVFGTQIENKIIGSNDIPNPTGPKKYPLPKIQGAVQTAFDLLMHDLPLTGRSGNDKEAEPGKQASESDKNSYKHLKEAETVGDDEERPTYRIIGGSAATGSGSPVSNKGRTADPNAA